MEERLYFADESLASLEVDSDQSLGSLVSMESLVVVVVVVVLVAPTAAVVSSAVSAAAESSAFAVPTAAAAFELATGLRHDLVVAVGSVSQPSGHTHLLAVMQFAGTVAGPQLLI